MVALRCVALAAVAALGTPSHAVGAPAATSGNVGHQVSELEFAALVQRVDAMSHTIEQQASTIARLEEAAALSASPRTDAPIAPPRESRVNVLAFGADPLGQADSTAAIQAAMDSFGGHGGIVDIPSGFFRCNSELVVPPSVSASGLSCDS